MSDSRFKTSIRKVYASARKNMTKAWLKRTAYQVGTFLLSVILVYAVGSYAISKSYWTRRLVFVDNFTITAHSGAMGTDDNSLESIQAAIDCGADIVEFDIRFRPDGTPVMAHDRVYTNKQGVPVEEAFALLAEHEGIGINLDVKETKYLSQVQVLAETYGVLERAVFTGVTEKFVPEVRKQAPKIPYYLNYSPRKNRITNEKYAQSLLELLEETGAVGINCDYKYANERLCEFLHDNGYLLSVWTVDKEDDMAMCLVMSPDNITTRHPDVLIDIIENWSGLTDRNV
ncbi:MAG: glycerophosphodiester phosphodiesterase [Clostridiales bacterium]|nr:glycerophosphodiester phosphodiesterase [Clostridiales bacterium]